MFSLLHRTATTTDRVGMKGGVSRGDPAVAPLGAAFLSSLPAPLLPALAVLLPFPKHNRNTNSNDNREVSHSPTGTGPPCAGHRLLRGRLPIMQGPRADGRTQNFFIQTSQKGP